MMKNKESTKKISFGRKLGLGFNIQKEYSDPEYIFENEDAFNILDGGEDETIAAIDAIIEEES